MTSPQSLAYFPPKMIVDFKLISRRRNDYAVGLVGLVFLIYLTLLDRFAALWLAQNPPTELTEPLRDKAKNAKKGPHPRTPLDCRHCQVQAEIPAQPVATAPVLVYNQTKSTRGRPKRSTSKAMPALIKSVLIMIVPAPLFMP